MKMNKKLKGLLLVMSPYLIIAVIIGLGGALILDVTAPPIEPFKFTWNGMLMFLAFCGGLGWVSHGTGFLLVRVK